MKQRPNVLFIMSDQHNANCFGEEGRRRGVETPNLDRIAGDGVTFGRAYCNNPICSPSRITFHTGQYCHTHRMLGNNHFEFTGEPAIEPLGERFRKHGYQTALIGKAHMVKKWDEAGFEHIRYCDLCDADRDNPLNHHYFKYLVDHGVADLYDDGSVDDPVYKENMYGVSKMPFEHTNERWTGNEAVEFLKNRDRRRPFLAHVSFERPHPNWLIAEEVKDLIAPENIQLPDCVVDAFEHRFQSKPPVFRKHLAGRIKDRDHLRKILAAYFTLITVIDGEIGRIIDCLKENGDYDDTVIVYTADHGDFGGDHGIFDKNIGIYESIHRIPFILKYPNGPKRVDIDHIIESVDLYPTLCELCDVPAPDGMDGESLVNLAETEEGGKPHALAEWDWSGYGRVNALRTRDWRIVYACGGENGPFGELYHNAEDPGEIHNLWDDPTHREVRMEMMEKLYVAATQYKLRTDMARDREIGRQTRHAPTRLLHKYRKKWSEIKDLCYP